MELPLSLQSFPGMFVQQDLLHDIWAVQEYTREKPTFQINWPILLYYKPGESAYILVNGKSYRSLGADKTNTQKPFSKLGPSSSETCQPETIKVRPNKSYRARIIGDVLLSPLVFALEDHDNLKVIAADSRYTHPAQTNIIQIGPWQRYDFIFDAKSEDERQQLGKFLFRIQLETRYR